MTTEPSAARAPNIRDVAREAGVSYQTVSRVLNDSPSLRPETRDRVLAVIERLGYRPNQAARALVTSKSRVIGVLVATRAAAYGVQTILYEIEDAARDAGYTIAIATTPSDESSVRQALSQLEGQSVEAVVVVAPQARVFDLLASTPLRVPLVMIDSQRRDLGHSIAVDQFEGARLATRHLIELGHRSIVHLAGPQDWNEAEERMRGFLAEMSDADMPTVAPVLGDWTADTAYEVGLKLLAHREFTAVFASNDQMALGLIHAANDLGLSVPGDLSVVGFDDIPEAKHFTPPLTTVRQDFALLGRRAIDILVADIEGSDAPPEAVFEIPELVIRASTAPPRSA